MRRLGVALVAVLMIVMPWKGEALGRSYSIEFAEDTAAAHSRSVKMAHDRTDQAYYAWKVAQEAAALIPAEVVNDYETASLKWLLPLQAMAGHQIAGKAERAAREAERYKARSAYYGLLRARGYEEIAREAVRVAEEQARIARQFHAVGSIPWLDVLKVEADLAEAEAGLASAEYGAAVARLSFNDMMGYNLEDAPVLDEEITFESMGKVDLDYHVEQAQRRRFEVFQADVLLGVKERDLELAEQYGSSNLKRMKAAAVSEAQKNVYKQMDDVKIQVYKAYESVVEAGKKVSLYRKGVASAEEGLRVTKIRQEQGLATDAEVMGAQMAVVRARNGYLEAIYQHNMAKSAFYYTTSEGVLSADAFQGGGTTAGSET